MHIRKAQITDIDTIMNIYARARSFMAETGNPNQWGPTSWPPKSLIENDITNGNCYVCVTKEADKPEEILGVFFFEMGEDEKTFVEPCYEAITNGSWQDNSPYGVVHRIATSGATKGVGAYCLDWAYKRSGHLRIDTHPDNKVMQNLLGKLGFICCGTIYVEEDDFPRLAFERVSSSLTKR